MGYTISIVDDEPRVRKGLSKLISSRGEAWSACRLFSSGNAALEAARAERVDVILADIRMPGLDGLELAYALRTASPDTVVVIMSGYKEFDYARRAMKVGVLDFIVKPIEEEELFAVLDRARAEVERRKSDRLRAASAGDLDALKDALLTEALTPRPLPKQGRGFVTCSTFTWGHSSFSARRSSRPLQRTALRCRPVPPWSPP